MLEIIFILKDELKDKNYTWHKDASKNFAKYLEKFKEIPESTLEIIMPELQNFEVI